MGEEQCLDCIRQEEGDKCYFAGWRGPNAPTPKCPGHRVAKPKKKTRTDGARREKIPMPQAQPKPRKRKFVAATVHLGDDQIDWLSEEVVRRGVSKAAIVREALDEKMAKEGQS